MSKASREIIKHYKKKCARKKSIKFRQVRVNEIEMISQAFYYSRARQQTKKRQLIDHQLSFSFSCAQDKTRTCTSLRSPAPEAGVSTNFTTWALIAKKACLLSTTTRLTSFPVVVARILRTGFLLVNPCC